MDNGFNKPLALIILDGWGYSPRIDGNAIALAHTPYYDEVCRKYPKTTLAASGRRVGLPADVPGNSEVGHLNLGTGRIVQTDVSRIENAVRSGQFLENQVLNAAFARAVENDAPVHLVGLLSDGGVHSSSENLFELLRMAKRAGAEKVFVHCFLDGRDVQPRTADIYVEALEIKIADIGVGKIASLCGRFFAMDGGENWERTARAYTMLVHAEGERTFDAMHTIRNSFLRGISDEFIAPIVIEKEAGVPVASVKDGDVVIFFNHRPDTMRQLVRSLALADEGAWTNAGRPRIDAVCMTEYDPGFDLPVAFKPNAERNVLTHVLNAKKVLNYSITETERLPHLTYFFNGGIDVDDPNARSEAEFIASATPDTFESAPETRSFKVTDRFLRRLESHPNSFFVVNLPAADLVAAIGNIESTVEALQYVDTCLGGILEKLRDAGGVAVITSSHGNVEEMRDVSSGESIISSTSNQVPFHIVDDKAHGLSLREGGSLADVAPTVLGILGIEKPSEMTGIDLRIF
jgi:2,3-bisphosphoglycerate-independent phosphoglycerate mutase